MSRINLKIFKLSWWQWLLMMVFVCFIFVIWPVKGFLLPSNWWGNSLIVVMNDNEARPCGGFATAYGELRLPLLKLDIGSTYELDADLGPAPEPLTKITDRLKFWDLGTSMDLNQCAEDFKAGYFANTAKEVDRVILVQISFLEKWAKMLGHDTFFADISRQVANVDHHDEMSLKTRKDPAGEMVGSFIKKTLLNPFRWRQAAELINDAEDNHYLFVPGKTKFVELEPNTIAIAEWNLGGGKSSRYLRKDWSVELAEHISNKSVVRISVDHLADYDAPLSQAWTGGFSLEIMGDEGESTFIPAEVGDGPNFYNDAVFYFDVKDQNTVSLRAPAYQNWQTQAAVSVNAQQTLTSQSLDVRESVGTWFGMLPVGGLNLDWEIQPDNVAPFLTLHKPLDANVLDESVRQELSWAEGDLIVELQFSEKIKWKENIAAELKDRNHSVSEITENPQLKGFTLLDNQTTLLLNWSQDEYQKDERFYLTLSGIEDVWGNEYVNAPRTVITR